MTPGKTYDLNSTVLAIGGNPGTGYGATDGIKFKPGSAILTKKVGASGDAVYSRQNDFTMTATLTLQYGTPFYGVIAALMQAQMNEVAGEITAIPFSWLDPADGTFVKDAQVLFMEQPELDFGKDSTERVFILDLPNGARPGNVAYGTTT